MLGRVRPGRLGKACRIWKIHIRRSVGKPWTSFPALLLFFGWCGGNVDAEAQGLRHSEATQWPWNPPVRGKAVRCRYRGRTIWGIPARSARMTAMFEQCYRFPGRTIRGILRLLTQALNDVQELKCGAGLSTPSVPDGAVTSATADTCRMHAALQARMRPRRDPRYTSCRTSARLFAGRALQARPSVSCRPSLSGAGTRF